MNQDERITNLEIKLSFSEDLLEELNQTVFKQQQRIELLVKEIQSLKLQMAQQIAPTNQLVQDLSKFCLVTTTQTPMNWLLSKMPTTGAKIQIPEPSFRISIKSHSPA